MLIKGNLKNKIDNFDISKFMPLNYSDMESNKNNYEIAVIDNNTNVLNKNDAKKSEKEKIDKTMDIIKKLGGIITETTKEKKMVNLVFF